MRKLISVFMIIVMAYSFCACKGKFGSSQDGAKKALKSECSAKKATKDQYKYMIDSKYDNTEIAEDFATGAFSEISSKDFTFFGFHAVVDHSKIKSCFKYLKIDPKSLDGDSITTMEVLIVEFDDKASAESYYNTLLDRKQKAYENNTYLDAEMTNEFKNEDNYFVYGNKTEFMVFHAYAKLEKNVVVYAFLEGPLNDTMEKEYKGFMDKMKYEYISM